MKTIDKVTAENPFEQTGDLTITGDIADGTEITITDGSLIVLGNVGSGCVITMKQSPVETEGMNIDPGAVVGSINNPNQSTPSHKLLIEGSIGQNTRIVSNTAKIELKKDGGTGLSITTNSGSINAKNIHPNSKLISNTGTIHAENVNGSTLKTNTGSIRVKNVSQSALSSHTGKIHTQSLAAGTTITNVKIQSSMQNAQYGWPPAPVYYSHQQAYSHYPWSTQPQAAYTQPPQYYQQPPQYYQQPPQYYQQPPAAAPQTQPAESYQRTSAQTASSPTPSSRPEHEVAQQPEEMIASSSTVIASPSAPAHRGPGSLKELTELIVEDLATKLRTSSLPDPEKRKFSNLLGILEKYKNVKSSEDNSYFFDAFSERLSKIPVTEENKALRNEFKFNGIGPIGEYITNHPLPERNITDHYKKAMTDARTATPSKEHQTKIDNIINKLNTYIDRTDENKEFSIFGESRYENRKKNVQLAKGLKHLFETHKQENHATLGETVQHYSDGAQHNVQTLVDAYVDDANKNATTTNYSVRSSELNGIINEIKNYENELESKHERDDQYQAGSSFNR